MDINLADISALGIVVLLVFMLDRRDRRMVTMLTNHLKRQTALLGKCSQELAEIKAAIEGQNIDKD
jgi:hypothetical protein